MLQERIKENDVLKLGGHTSTTIVIAIINWHLSLVRITKKFPGFTVGPLNLRIENGKILVVIGPTGSGKSTILNLIAGLLKPDSGSILLDGLDITTVPCTSSKNRHYLSESQSIS